MTFAPYIDSEHAQQFIQAEVIRSSISPDGQRLDTLKLRYPRMVHADFLTHRVFSRNSSSSRAMPSATLLKQEPYVPQFRHNQSGMQPAGPLSHNDQLEAEAIWLDAARYCQDAARRLSEKDGLNVHKQWANRMLEWFGYITVVVTSTDFSNYLGLRDHEGAQDEIIWQAQAVKEALAGAVVEPVALGDWHLPFIRQDDHDFTAEFIRSKRGTPTYREIIRETAFAFSGDLFVSMLDRLLLIQSASRCARTSYNNFDGSRMTLEKDVETFCKLGSRPIHASPFEHQARPAPDDTQPHLEGNLRGWHQFRKFIPDECIFAG